MARLANRATANSRKGKNLNPQQTPYNARPQSNSTLHTLQHPPTTAQSIQCKTPKPKHLNVEHTVPEAWAEGSAGWPGQSVAGPETECCCVGSPDCLPQLLQHLQKHLPRLLHHLQPVPAVTQCHTSCIPPPAPHAFPVDLSDLHRHVQVTRPQHADEQHQSNAMLAQVSVQAEYKVSQHLSEPD